MQQEPMTNEGFELLTNMLNDMKVVQKPIILRSVEEARELGDLKENAEYHAAKEEQANIEKRIAELEDSGKIFVQKLAISLLQTDNLKMIEISGHTDSRPVAKNSQYKNNLELSFARASTIASIMIKEGISPQKLKIIGEGSFKPIVKEYKNGKSILKNMETNRRIEIKILRNKKELKKEVIK